MAPPSHLDPPTRGATSQRGARFLMVVRVVAALTAVWLLYVLVNPVPGHVPRAFGWDETMHSELPAVEMLLRAQRGEWGHAAWVLHACDRYPFVHPVVLAISHGLFGLGEAVGRGTGVFLFLLVVFGAARLARRLAGPDPADAPGGASPAHGRSWLAFDASLFGALLALSSPLARRYAPTVWLEVPALVTIAAALNLWLMRRGAKTSRSRVVLDLATGVVLAAAFFTKFNYGALLLLALGLDGLVELGRAVVGRDHLGKALRSHLRVALPLLLGLAWWFLLPLPFGEEVARVHRAQFAGFMAGNTEMPTPRAYRVMNWVTGIAPHVVLLGGLLGAALGLIVCRARRTATWTVALALLAFALPVALHPFQLDRFWLPAAFALWAMGGAALALLLHRAPWLAAALGLALGGLATQFSNFDAVVAWGKLTPAPVGTPVRLYQEEQIGAVNGIFGPPASNGLPQATFDAILDGIAGAVGPDESVGWLGQSSEISPAALHLGLLERGGSPLRYLQGAKGPMDIVPIPSNVKLEFSQAQILEYAERFDAVLLVAEGDLGHRQARAWIPESLHQPLLQSPRASVETLLTLEVDLGLLGQRPITLQLVRIAP